MDLSSYKPFLKGSRATLNILDFVKTRTLRYYSCGTLMKAWNFASFSGIAFPKYSCTVVATHSSSTSRTIFRKRFSSYDITCIIAEIQHDIHGHTVIQN